MTSAAGETAIRFQSLAALRSAHGALLKRQAPGGDSPELLADVEDFLRKGRATGVLLDDEDDRWSAQSALDYWGTVLHRLARLEVDTDLAELAPDLAPELAEGDCPYVGLEPFRDQEVDRERFFGRSGLIKKAAEKLKTGRLLAVLGPPGSGKSSLVLAGLLPALRAGAAPGEGDFRCVMPLASDAGPLHSLAHALLPADVADPGAWVAEQAARMLADPQHLARLAGEPGGRPAVLVVDPLEELFAPCADAAVRQAFVDNLLGLVRTPAPRHLAILALRSTFETPALQPLFERQVRATPLGAAELTEVIEKPAERIGLRIEASVVSALRAKIVDEPAGLPLLQHTLLELWAHRERNRITWEAYQRAGGGREALTRSAGIWYDGLSAEEQGTARRLLLRIVRPGEGPEAAGSRIRRGALSRPGEEPGRIGSMLEKLIRARLVRLTPGQTPADDLLEIAHDALVRTWQRLVEWLGEAQAEIAVRRRLEIRASEWVRLGRGHGGLLDEVQLQEAERWIASPEAAELGYDAQLTDLVKASRAAVDQARLERRRKRRLRRWIVAAALLAGILYVGGTVLFASWAKDAALEGLEIQNGKLENDNAKAEKEKAELDAEVERLALDKMLAEEELDKLNDDRAGLNEENKLLKGTLRSQSAQEKQLQLAITKATKDAEQSTKAAETANRSATDAANRQRNAEASAAEAQGELERKLKARNDDLKKAIEGLKAVEQRAAHLDEQLVDGKEGDPRSLRQLFSGVALSEFRQRPRGQPVRLGASISTLGKGSRTGTLCCEVRDSAGQRYLLSLRTVLAGNSDPRIIQPGRDDSGTEDNAVAVLTQVGTSNPFRSGAIARLNQDIKVDYDLPKKIGKIRGIATSVVDGETIFFVGRGSGFRTRKLKITRHDPDGSLVTNISPSHGDTGGLVLTKDYRLIGLLWGWSTKGRKESYVTPIQPILVELGVTLSVK